MKVFELSLQIAFAEATPQKEVFEKMALFVRTAVEERRGKKATSGKYTGYVFDQPYPLEESKVYFPGKIYTVHIRTVIEKMAELFKEMLPFYSTGEVQGLSGELAFIPEAQLFRVYSITPVLLRTRDGYWRSQMGVREFEELLKKDLIQKYNYTHRFKMAGDFPLFRNLRIENHKPIQLMFDDRIMLGDKVSIMAAPNRQAQELLYLALGMGIGDGNGNGYGFLGYRFFQEW